MALRAAVDVGGTKTRIEVFREISVERPELCRVLDTPTEGEVLEKLAEAVVELAGGKPIESVAVASPGPLDPVNGVVLNPPNLSRPWWELEISAELGARLSSPVVLENDCNLGALGEAAFGAGHDHDSILYVTVSTGVGAGLIVNGQIFSGSRGLAGELGHTTVTDREFPCGCGRNGCVEAVASGTAIARQALRRGWKPLPGNGSVMDGSVTARDVARAASAGEVEAREILREAAGHLGRALVNFIYAYDPDIVILGGGVAQSQIFFEMVQRALSTEPIMPAFSHIPVRRATLGERSVICGARTLAERLVR
ncbi:ROK family protein [Rubrobacter aplysinae]|uniref:ROK family protein n=1 Tax=Rubrobacter aplysinae TaxID=909625 RepID=UPI00069FAF41|nr:ROK family protein [Rubrobacter aplysinae]